MRPAIVVLITLTLLPIAAPTASAGAVLFADDMESGTSGWNATGLWNQSTLRAASPTTSWHYGMEGPNGTSTFNTGGANAGSLASPLINLSGVSVARLRFWSFWSGEGCAFEHPIVGVVPGNGTLVKVWENCGSQGNGTFEVNLSAFAGQSIRIVFLWDTLDDVANDFEGWYVDDVVVDETGEPAPPALPADLVPSAIAGPATASIGQPVTFSANVTNAGAGNVTSGFSVSWFVNNTLVNVQTFPSGLATGKSVATNATFTPTTGGNRIVTAIVDSAGNVPESNEGNNVASKGFTVIVALPDLVVADVRVNATVLAGQTHPVTATIANAAAFNVSSGFTVAWILDGATVATRSAPPGMPAGGTVDLSAPVQFPAHGAFVLSVVADAGNQVSEAIEGNNVLSRIVDVLPSPQVSVHVRELRRVPLITEAAEVRHPLSRWEATIEACNLGGANATQVSTSLEILGGNGRNTGAGSHALATFLDPVLASGACKTRIVRFDTPGVVGDFRLRASVAAAGDFVKEDDHDEAAGYNLVQDEGGVVLPNGVRHRS